MIEHLYLTSLGMFAYVVIYVPLTLLVSWAADKYLLRKFAPKQARRWITGVLMLALVTAPLWDVYYIGLQAKQVCRTYGGLHVYKKGVAEGFIHGDISFWSKRGFKYTEGVGMGDKKLRFSVRDGKVVEKEITEFASQYAVQSGADQRPIGHRFTRNSVRVVNLRTHEVLGELVKIFVYPGWFDRLVIGATGTGSGFSPWTCGNEPPAGRQEKLNYKDVVEATLVPG